MSQIYEVNRRFSDEHLPQVRQIIAEEIIQVAPFIEDTKHATDLVVLTIKRGQIAVRLRRPGYAQKYPWDLTIRCRAAGHNYNTEFRKIVEEGWADLFFYGHLGRNEIIERWFLIDLDVFRSELETKPYLLDAAKQNNVRTNRDIEQTQLISFDIRQFNLNIIINSSHPVPRSQS